ncbi:hypothetical protein DSO57_1000972 [Entomophthora muscae]|uniref:Uncharacterized protein n=1 Tax=Entomophthora muscae TaxID=34485 RepID=A0ACC2UJ19_9FUNG|nr:hypothetical protein DSO57_1000972 [Entomophthora muscae]
MILLLTVVLLLLASLVLLAHQWKPEPRIAPIPSLSLLQTLKLMFQDISYNDAHAMTRQVTEEHKVMRMVSFGNWAVVVTSKDAVPAILSDSATFPKAMLTDAIPGTLFARYMGNSLAFSHGADWKRQRSIVSPPFRKMFSIQLFHQLAEQFVAQMKPGVSFDPHVYTQKITIDALGKALLGLEFGTLGGNNSEFVEAYRGVTDVYLHYTYLAIPCLDSPNNPFRAQAFRDMRFVEDFLADTIRHRHQDLRDDSTDILSLMLKAKTSLSDQELMYNMKMFIVAGHDTTSFALSAAMFLLAQHQEIQRQLHHEIMRTCGTRPPTHDDLKQMHLLDAVIKETLRMYPPSAILALRIATKDTTICGYDIPKGTGIIPDVFAMQNDPEYWPEPNKFIPSRFLDAHGKPLEKLPGPWLPFSGGERTCLGLGFSLLEQRVVLAKTIATYNIHLQPPAANISLLNSIILRSKPFHVKFLEWQ